MLSRSLRDSFFAVDWPDQFVILSQSRFLATVAARWANAWRDYFLARNLDAQRAPVVRRCFGKWFGCQRIVRVGSARLDSSLAEGAANFCKDFGPSGAEDEYGFQPNFELVDAYLGRCPRLR
jgi:hypothetical protein